MKKQKSFLLITHLADGPSVKGRWIRRIKPIVLDLEYNHSNNKIYMLYVAVCELKLWRPTMFGVFRPSYQKSDETHIIFIANYYAFREGGRLQTWNIFGVIAHMSMQCLKICKKRTKNSWNHFSTKKKSLEIALFLFNFWINGVGNIGRTQKPFFYSESGKKIK